MRQFFKFLFASLLGSLVAFFLIFVFVIAMAFASVASFGTSEPAKVEDHSIYAPDLSKSITERNTEDMFGFGNFNFSALQGEVSIPLPELLKSIEDAKYDAKIDALFLDLGIVPAGRTSVLAIKKAVEDFKTSGKKVYAYADFYTNNSYLLASAADSIFMQPTGMIEFAGMSTEMMFFKGAFEKLDIEPRVIKHGRYKSAGEPFSEKKMSEYNRKQNTELIYSIYNHFLAEVSAARGMDTAKLSNIAKNMLVRNAEDGLKYGLIDKLIQRDEMLEKLAQLSGAKAINKIAFTDFKTYSKAKKEVNFDETKVAVIYATGNIIMGKGSESQIGSETLSKAIREARLDENVKAIVLRINSGGGSALASDVILREVVLAKEAKPVIVSMGDVAASGGYYIACKADRIIAQPNTITGSIGVIGILAGTQKFFENKLGITFDRIKTGKYADLGNPNRELSAEERAIITRMLDDIYVDFITHVGEGRGMDTATVDALGGGRVWTGLQALENGLVDELGGMNRALEVALEESGLTGKDYRIVEYPKLKSPFEEILGIPANMKQNMIKEELGVNYNTFKKLKEIQAYNGPMMILPFEY